MLPIIFAALVFRSSLGEILVLNKDNFDQYVDGSTNILVDFSAPWCGSCQYQLKPEWKIAEETFLPTDDVKFVSVDGTENPVLIEKYGIERYPTIKFFPKGSTVAEDIDIELPVTAEKLVKWINDKIGTARVVESPVVKLTSQNFDIVVSGPRAVFLRFYAPWSGHCKRLSYNFREIGKVYANDSEVVIAEVDGTTEPELVSRFDLKGYPTIMFFPAGSTTPEYYKGGREVGNFVEFLNNRVETRRDAGGSRNDQTGTAQIRIKKNSTSLVEL